MGNDARFASASSSPPLFSAASRPRTGTPSSSAAAFCASWKMRSSLPISRVSASEVQFSSLCEKLHGSYRGLGAVSRGSHSFFDPPFSVCPLCLDRMVLIALLSTPGRVLPARMSFLL